MSESNTQNSDLIDTENYRKHVKAGFEELFKSYMDILLDNGQKVNHCNNRGKTALMVCIEQKNIYAIDLLLKNYYENSLDLSLVTKENESIFHMIFKN